jgi:hypothetical protein
VAGRAESLNDFATRRENSGAIVALQTPAGSSERFSTLAAIQRNHEAFVIACHDAWEGLQTTAIKEISYFDGFLRREQTHPIGQIRSRGGGCRCTTYLEFREGRETSSRIKVSDAATGLQRKLG